MATVVQTGTVTINAAFLQEIKEVNQDLWALLAELRHRCQRPLAPGACRWLLDRLCQLRDQLALHFSLEEAYRRLCCRRNFSSYQAIFSCSSFTNCSRETHRALRDSMSSGEEVGIVFMYHCFDTPMPTSRRG
ncbi:MAG: hypothetical protein K6U02_08700 [Firmicutes bacterium]|nr:hypothetical protein [Bacillota bacterium]